MACFNSTLKAQTISVCQFCEECSEIKWKCINCDLLLCQFCTTRIHSKSKSSTEHEIINLRDCVTEFVLDKTRKVDLKKMTCAQHSNEKCVLHCKNCNMPVCCDCLIGDHHNHTYSKLDKVYKENIEDIRDIKSKIESDIPFFNEQRKYLLHILSEDNKQFTEDKDKIIEIRDNIVKHADVLLSKLDQLRKPREETINKELYCVTQRKDGLEKRKSQLNLTLSSPSASDVFDTSLFLDKTMPDKTVSQAELSHRKFTPGKLSKQPMSNIFGSVNEYSDIKIVQTYNTEFDHTIKFIKCDDNLAFMGTSWGDVLQKVTVEKDRIIQCSELKETLLVFDMAMMNNGDLLVSSGKTELKLYTTDNQVKTFGTVFPLYTLGVHVNKQNEIFLGFSDSDYITISNDIVRRVVLMDHNGDIKQCFEYDRDNQRLFTWPRRICSNDKYIFVVDLLHGGPGRVVVIDKVGQLQWNYNGSVDKFDPKDIAVTSTEIVIVTDCNNHALHILSLSGEVIICKKISELCIHFPCSLSIDDDDKLWVGTSDSKSKVHALRLT